MQRKNGNKYVCMYSMYVKYEYMYVCTCTYVYIQLVGVVCVDVYSINICMYVCILYVYSMYVCIQI